jgi:hypothetical protein
MANGQRSAIMVRAERRLAELGIELSPPPLPLGIYGEAVQTRNLLLRRPQPDDTISRATDSIDPGLNPNLASSDFKGADAPKVCMPIMRPFGPM